MSVVVKERDLPIMTTCIKYQVNTNNLGMATITLHTKKPTDSGISERAHLYREMSNFVPSNLTLLCKQLCSSSIQMEAECRDRISSDERRFSKKICEKCKRISDKYCNICTKIDFFIKYIHTKTETFVD